MTDGNESEPDRIHHWTPSRRQALALGAGLMGGLAGCSELSENLSGDSSDATSTEQPPLEEAISASVEYGYEAVSLELDIDGVAVDTLSGTLRLSAAPNLDPSDETVIAETEIEQAEQIATHTLTPDWSLGYAQQLRFSIERTESEQPEENDLYTPDEMVVPFYNAADGREVVRELGPREPDPSWISATDNDDLAIKTFLWFNEPEESLFNTPEVPESEYDPEWYPYRDIEVSVMVKYPSYENLIELKDINDQTGQVTDRYHVPIMDAVAFSFKLGAWELLEAFRWNSVSTHKFEQGVREYGDPADDYELVNDSQQLGSTMMSSSRNFEMDAAPTPDFFNNYNGSRYTDVSADVNPLKAAAGRPISYRIADSMSSALDNPSFNTHEYQDYQKALVLQGFVGWNPYSFSVSSYSLTPEEAINRWFLTSQGSGDGVGNCQDGVNLYCGIASHLLNATPGFMTLNSNGNFHATAGLLDLRMPDEPFEIWPDHPSSYGGEPFAKETDYGSVSIVECTYPDPIIGWKLHPSGQIELKTYLSNSTLQTHMALNDDNEPDQDGIYPVGRGEPEIPWEFHENNNTIDDVDDL